MVPPLLAFWALLVRNAFAFSAIAIASPFAKMSVFQLCASLGDQNGQIITVISIFLAVNMNAHEPCLANNARSSS